MTGKESLVSAMFASEIDNLLLTAGHDLNALRPPLIADVTQPGERYLGIGGREIDARPGDMTIRDAEAILSTVLCGPNVRTRLLPETNSVLFTTYAPDGMSDAQLERHLREIEGLVQTASPFAITETIGSQRA